MRRLHAGGRASARTTARWAAGVLLLTLALPASALGQATRTWVSGVGDDANPCSRTAPCKTFAGAISKTAVAGEIDVLDPGGFGAVDITKSLTISATGVTAGVLVSGTNGITVSAGANDHVTLKGLDINGTNPSGLGGVRINSAASVRVESSSIYGFTVAGIDFEPTTPNTRLVVTDTAIHDNTGDGVLNAPRAGGSGSIVLNNDSVDANLCGLVATTLGLVGGTICETPASGPAAGSAQIFSNNTSLSNNSGVGVLSNGNGAGNTISRDLITGNATGLQAINGGSILSLGGNDVFGNISDGAPTAVSDAVRGPAGPSGPGGSPGAGGPIGPAGPTGASGQIELVTCNTVTRTVRRRGKKRKISQQQCTAKLTSKPVKFTTVGAPRAASVTLARSGRVYATGSARLTRTGTTLVLASSRPLASGRYTLKLTSGRHVLGRETVLVF